MLKTMISLFIAFLLTGCGGLTYYAHDDVRSAERSALKTITMRPGQELKMLTHRTGIMWGGYKEGIVIEDPSIAAIRYGKDGSDNWAPAVYLIGLKPGRTRAAYCNRLGERPDFGNPLDRKYVDRSFEVIVKSTEE